MHQFQALLPGLSALADVDDRGQYEYSAVGLDRAQASLYVELCSVLAEAGKFPACSHRTRTGFGEEALPMAGMLCAEALGEKNLDDLTQQLLSPVAKESFDLRIDQGDAALAVG